jgi:hypothetical protein
MVDPDAVAVGDCLEADSDSPLDPGVYRVVGSSEHALVCLRVTDDRGKRAATGHLERVSDADASALEFASEPRPTVHGFLRNLVQGPYWTLRSIV